jgi:hypothetical protein
VLPGFNASKAPLASALPTMNAAANSDASGPLCRPKKWFAVSIVKVDEKNKETKVEGVTIDLQIPGIGQTQRITGAGDNHPIVIPQLNPGGTGEVLQMNHDTDVYEAIGDFQ